MALRLEKQLSHAAEYPILGHSAFLLHRRFDSPPSQRAPAAAAHSPLSSLKLLCVIQQLALLPHQRARCLPDHSFQSHPYSSRPQHLDYLARQGPLLDFLAV